MNNTVILHKQAEKIIFSIGCNGEYDDYEFEINNNLDFMGNIVSVIDSENQSLVDKETLSLKDKNVFIIDKPSISLQYRKDLAKIMFDLLNISSLYITSQSMLCLHDNDITTGLVVDYCDGKIFTVPIYDENLIKKSISEVKIGNTKKSNLVKDKIEQKIKSTIKKCNVTQQIEIDDNIIFSSILPSDILEEIDGLNGDIIIGDALDGAKKIIPLLNSYNCWVTKEKYNQTGSHIIEKRCFN